MDEDEQLTVKVPLREYEVMVKAVAALADIRRGDKIIIDKAKYDELLKVGAQVDALLGKFDEAREAGEASSAPPARVLPGSCPGLARVLPFPFLSPQTYDSNGTMTMNNLNLTDPTSYLTKRIFSCRNQY